MTKNIFSFTLSILLLLSGGTAYGIALDANGIATDAKKGPVIESASIRPLTFPQSPTTILMDYSHGLKFENYPYTNYKNLIALLEAQGHTVVASSDGILNLNLDDYGIIILNSVWSGFVRYSNAEINALNDFVDGGGGLLILGEAEGCGGCDHSNFYLGEVAQKLAGITLGISSISPTDLYFSNFSSHDIFSGITQLYYRFSGGLGVVSPGQELAWTDSSSAVTVAAHNKIIVLGDVGITADGEYWGRADDQLFIENIFNFLSDGAVNSLSISPPKGEYITTQGFDLTFIVEAPGLSVTGLSSSLDGRDVSSALSNCVIPGTLISGGQTFRCPGISGSFLGAGTHNLSITLYLSDGSSVSDTVEWEVRKSTEMSAP